MTPRPAVPHGVLGALSAALAVLVAVVLSVQMLASSSLVTIVACATPQRFTGWSGVHVATQGEACREVIDAMATEGRVLSAAPVILVIAVHVLALNLLGALWAAGLTAQLADLLRRVLRVVVRPRRRPSTSWLRPTNTRPATPVVVSDGVVAILAVVARRHPRRGPPSFSLLNAA